MNALLPWLYVVMESLVLAWAPALLLAVVFLGIGLVFGWAWKAFYLLPMGPILVLMVLAGWGLGLPYTPAPAHENTIRIAHANTLYKNTDGPKVVFAQNADADVVSLLEATETLPAAMERISGTYPHQVHTVGQMSMMLVAKYPITRAQGWGTRMVLYHIAKPNQAFYVLQVHPQSPYSVKALADRTANFEKLASILPSLPQPLVVLGDMNTTPWDAGMKPLHAVLKQAGGWRAYVPTFPSFLPMTPIDALFYSQPFTEARLQHVKVKGSDHLGIVVDLVDLRQK